MMDSRARWLIRLAAGLLIAAQIPVLLRTALDPSQSDFANYFTPAYVLVTGGNLGALYDRDGFEEGLAQAGLSGLGSFVPHPPANALWLLPFAAWPPEVAKGVWSLVLVLSIAVTVAVMAGLSTRLDLGVCVVLVLAPTLAIRNGLAFGQPYLVLAAWLACGVLALEKDRPLLGGFLLGLGASFKPYCLGIGFLLAHRQRRRSLTGFILGAILPSAVACLLAGTQPFVEFSLKVAPWMLRGDIQDPFSPGWGSITSLVNRLLRFEPDLNPHPWAEAPLLARYLAAAASATLLGIGVIAGRRAMAQGRQLDAVGITLAVAFAASPYVASYHLVLLGIPVLAVLARLQGTGQVFWILAWALLGSEAMSTFRSATGVWTPVAYARLVGLLGLALAVARPYLNRRAVNSAVGVGMLVGILALPWEGKEGAWERITEAKGYSMLRPHFCGPDLRWWSPADDGRRLETRGAGEDCAAGAGPTRETPPPGPIVTSRFRNGSWNVYLREAAPLATETRITFSDANEVDPMLTPDGCAVVFASDQGRGLGSTALYRLDLSGLIGRCERAEPGAVRR